MHEHECKSGLLGRSKVLRLIKEEVVAGGYDVVFTAYIPGISLLKRFFLNCNVKVIVDIRSGFLVKNPLKRFLLNRLLRFECRRFETRTINSELLGGYLGFVEGEVTELPLGAEPVSTVSRTFDKLHLLYVGALSKRNVQLTVTGLKKFMNRHGEGSVEKYDIVGTGSPEDEQAIRDAIVTNGLEEIVEMHGYIPREDMADFLKVANVGVSFVPMTPYYDMQPVTKTYEFLLAGLPLVATRTTQNKRFVNEANGILIDDTPESFAQGLTKIKSKFDAGGFNSEGIQEASKKHSWENVILGKYIPFIEENIKQTVTT